MHHNLYQDDYSNISNWITRYIDENNGSLIVTDFDEETNVLNAEFPLSQCIQGDISVNQIQRYCQNIHKKFNNENA
jgi:hypothetical protein